MLLLISLPYVSSSFPLLRVVSSACRCSAYDDNKPVFPVRVVRHLDCVERAIAAHRYAGVLEAEVPTEAKSEAA